MAIKDEPRERLAEMASVLSEATKLLWEVSGSMERTGPPRLRIQLSTALMSDLVQMPMGTVFDAFDTTHIYPINLPSSVRAPDLLAKGDVFSMQPLVYSAGPDGLYGIIRDRVPPIHYTDSTYKLNPYFDPSPDRINGATDTAGTPGVWADNIHSHAITTR